MKEDLGRKVYAGRFTKTAKGMEQLQETRDGSLLAVGINPARMQTDYSQFEVPRYRLQSIRLL